MKVQVLRKTPDDNSVTLVIGFREYVVTLDQYIEIIKPLVRMEGSGSDYIQARNKLLTEYFINGPKEQFSW
jgi:hypothetical protein